MKKILSILLIQWFALSTFAADEASAGAASTPQPAEAKYTAVLEARTADILKSLALDDTNKAAAVHDIIIAQYRALNGWHDTNDAKLKELRKDPAALKNLQASLKQLHNEFLARLAVDLTPSEIETVKDKMTYGKVQFTFRGYCVQYPDLTEANKQAILNLLKEAREEAMDCGSAKEKTAVFQRYKGKINNYLSKQGLHPEKTKSDAN